MIERPSHRRALSTIGVLLALGVAAAGCGGGDPDPAGETPTPSSSPSSSTSTSPSAEPTRSAAFPSYVALGDSYTAAPLVPDTDTTNGCLRSSQNYPELLAAAIGSALTDVSCVGATSTAMIGAQQTSNGINPPQFDALQSDTSLVTLGLGGNDFGTFGTLIGSCTGFDSGSDGSPCTDQLTQDGKDQITSDLDDLVGRIDALVSGIKQRSPDARVIVVGYPQVVPSAGSCTDLPLAKGDYAFALEINRKLSTALQQGARMAGADFIDVFTASKGHDICSDDPWINGAITDPARALAFHPFAEEQQAVAKLIEQDLAKKTDTTKKA